MTTTLRPPAKAQNTSALTPSPANRSRSASATALRRNRSRIGLGVVVIALSVLGAVTLINRGAERAAALALARDVPAGAVLSADDLITVDLPLDTGVPTVAADDAHMIVGQAASVTLLEGTLLNPSHLSATARVPDGMALLGALLDPGQYPVGLREGDVVRLISSVPSSDLTAGSTIEDLGTAEVVEMAEPITGPGALVVSLLVPDAQAGRVSTAGAEGRISLVVVESR